MNSLLIFQFCSIPVANSHSVSSTCKLKPHFAMFVLISKLHLSFKPLLHLANFPGTCFAILLWHKLCEKFSSITYPATDIPHNFFTAAIFARSRNQLLVMLQQHFQLLHSVPSSLQLVLQHSAASSNRITPSNFFQLILL